MNYPQSDLFLGRFQAGFDTPDGGDQEFAKWNITIFNREINELNGQFSIENLKQLDMRIKWMNAYENTTCMGMEWASIFSSFSMFSEHAKSAVLYSGISNHWHVPWGIIPWFDGRITVGTPGHNGHSLPTIDSPGIFYGLLGRFFFPVHWITTFLITGCTSLHGVHPLNPPSFGIII